MRQVSSFFSRVTLSGGRRDFAQLIPKDKKRAEKRTIPNLTERRKDRESPSNTGLFEREGLFIKDSLWSKK
jgi:hypothetical protein